MIPLGIWYKKISHCSIVFYLHLPAFVQMLFVIKLKLKNIENWVVLAFCGMIARKYEPWWGRQLAQLNAQQFGQSNIWNSPTNTGVKWAVITATNMED